MRSPLRFFVTAAFPIAIAILVFPTDGRADDASVKADMDGYYAGERNSGWFATGLGVVSAGGGAYLVTRDGELERGLGWSLIGMGAFEAIVGIGYAFTVNGEIDHYRAAYDRDRSAFRDEEVTHIQGTISRFVYYRLIEAAMFLTGAGLATYGFIAKKDAFKGAGIGIGASAVPLIVMDTINNERAKSYEEHLRTWSPSTAPSTGPTSVRVSPSFGALRGARGPAWSLSLNGAF